MNDQIEEERPCIRGCIRKGTDEPLVARHGPYCNRCYYQYARALGVAAELVEHVVSLVSFQARSDDKVDGSREAPMPFNLQAFHDANETYRRLAYWASVWSGRLNEPLPGTLGKVWRNRSGHIVGLRRGAPAHIARQQTQHVVRWLTDRLDRILALAERNPGAADDLDFWRDELKDLFTLNARWPRDPQPRYSDVPCPDDKGRLAIYPPLEFGDDERIVCEKCGRHFPIENYEFLIRLFREVQKDEAKTARVARHLLKKHAIGSGT